MAGRERREKEWGLAVAPILDVVLGTTREMLHRVDFWGRSLPFCGRLRFAVVFLKSPPFLHSWRRSDIMVDLSCDEGREIGSSILSVMASELPA